MELNPIIHQLVWDNLPEDLDKFLVKNAASPDNQQPVFGAPPTPNDEPSTDILVPMIDKKFRGITALGLACQLGRYECAKVLLKHEASCYEASDIGFLPFQDANGYGDRDLMKLLFLARHEQLQKQWAKREALLHQVLCMVKKL
jgi:hypothetical protein